jgi:Spy/CpxP family protein refolding chaperone
MKKTVLIGLTALGLLTASAGAIGFGKGCHHHGGKMIFNKFMTVSNLTEEQEEALKSQFRALKEERQANREAHRESRRATFTAVITENGLDREKFIETENRRHREKVQKRADNLEKLLAILTPDQRLELKSEIEKR